MEKLMGWFAVLAAAGTLGSAAGASGAHKSVLERHAGAGVVVMARDGEDGTARRAVANDAHLAFIEEVFERILVAGPLYAQDGRQVIGSLYVLDVKSLAEARELIEADPFYQAGVWTEIDYLPYLPAAGTWVGGTVW